MQTNAAENAAVSIESLESLLAPDAATLRSVLEPLFAPKSPGLRRTSSRASFKAALLSIPVEEIPESDSEELSKAKVALNGDTEAAVSIQEVSIKTQFETRAESFVSAIEAGVGSKMDGSAELASNPIPEIREEEAS